MPRYGFVSPGGMAANAIQEFLVRRELENRQRMMDEMAQQRQAADINLRSDDLNLRRTQEARIAEAQAQQQRDLEQQREFGRATVIAENALPGDPVDEATRAILQRQGFGGQARQIPGVVMQGPLPADQTEADRPVGPDTYEMRGGSKYLSARAAEDARAAQAAEAAAARAAQAEEARADREAAAVAQREFQAAQNQLNRDNTRAIAGARGGGRGGAGEGGAGAGSDYATQTADRTIGAIDDVLPKINNWTAGAGGAILSRIPGTPAANVSAELATVAGNIAFNALQQMRNASKTGGALGTVSERELDLLSSVEASIRQNQSPENLKAQLGKVRASMERFKAAEALGGSLEMRRTGTGGAAGPKAGDKKTFPNGRRATFDGTGWVPD